jgi:putative SOS response-associated peptidase YedK
MAINEMMVKVEIFFEPRNTPMTFEKLSDTAAELHQKATPTFHLESWTRFELVAPRCLIPATAFYEWQKQKAGAKQPYAIRLTGSDLFAFAGLWETWTNHESGEEVESCAILTTGANELMKPIHDRMPVILPEEAYSAWLEQPDAALLQPYPADRMEAIPVSTYVNSPRNQGPKCIEEAKAS